MPPSGPYVHMFYTNILFMPVISSIVRLVKSVRLRRNGLELWKYRPCRILLTERLGKWTLGTSKWLSKYNIRIDF